MTALVPAYAEAQEYLQPSKAPSTLRAYRAEWAHFQAWCGERGRKALPGVPETLALYLTELARGHHVSTLTRRLAAIAAAHHAADYESPGSAPGVRTLMGGIRRVKGTAPATQKKPLLVADLARIESALPENLLGTRNAALWPWASPPPCSDIHDTLGGYSRQRNAPYARYNVTLQHTTPTKALPATDHAADIVPAELNRGGTGQREYPYGCSNVYGCRTLTHREVMNAT
jgi:hypothetical protein